jgi:hypothetical protein
LLIVEGGSKGIQLSGFEQKIIMRVSPCYFLLTKRWQGDMFGHLMNEYSIVFAQGLESFYGLNVQEKRLVTGG